MWVRVLDYNFISSHYKTTPSRLVCYAQWLLCTFSGGSVLNYCSASMIDQPLQKSESVGHGKHHFLLSSSCFSVSSSALLIMLQNISGNPGKPS